MMCSNMSWLLHNPFYGSFSDGRERNLCPRIQRVRIALIKSEPTLFIQMPLQAAGPFVMRATKSHLLSESRFLPFCRLKSDFL